MADALDALLSARAGTAAAPDAATASMTAAPSGTAAPPSVPPSVPAPATASADPLDTLLAARASSAPSSSSGPQVDLVSDAEVARENAADKAAPPQPTPPAQPPGLLAQAGRQLGLTARMVGNGAADAVDFVGAPINATVNALGSAIGHDPQLQNPGNPIRALTNAYTPAPVGALENGVQQAGSAAVSALPTMGVGALASGAANPLVRLIGSGLAAAPAQQVLASGIGGAASNAAGQAGAGPVGQMLAGFAGGAAGLKGLSEGAQLGNSLLAAMDKSGALATPMRAEPSIPATAPKPSYRPNGDGTFTPSPRGGPPPETTPSAPAGVAAPPAAPTEAAALPPPQFDAPSPTQPKTVLPEHVQAENMRVMREIGLDSQRPSAIAGDKFMAGQEYQQSKLVSPMGEVMNAQLAKEQSAVKGFAQNIVNNTGTVSDSPEAVGQAIRAPLQGLSQHYDDAISSLYKAADERAGGKPTVEVDSLSKLISDPDFRETLMAKNQQGLLGAVERQLERFQGTAKDDSTTAPNTVQSAERFRQWLNQIWTPESSGTIGKLKEALDTDVTKSAGEDVYGAARALHAERKNTLDNPNGISALLNESGPNGINKQVPDEKVAQRVLGMPTAQLKHVVDTINGLPGSLAPQGQQALAEMKGALARQIYKAGDSGGTQNGPSLWNAANVTKQLNAQKSKIGLLFSPQEIEQFQTLNSAGHILQAPSAYPGAAVQGHNLLQRGMIYAPPALGAAVGGHLFGGAGVGVGSTIGGAVSMRMARNADIASANKLKAAMASPQVVRGK